MMSFQLVVFEFFTTERARRGTFVALRFVGVLISPAHVLMAVLALNGQERTSVCILLPFQVKVIS